MKVLVTSARFPFALELVRKLGAAGHEVVATDSFSAAPGLHSRLGSEHFVTPSPAHDTDGFVAELARIVEQAGVDVLVPAFEDVFYVTSRRQRLEGLTRVFAADFATLASLHSKGAFVELCQRSGLPVPDSRVARSDQELATATQAYERYFGRPSFSRSGVYLLTNHGPRAGRLPIEDCHPTDSNPWVVAEFVEGTDVCSYSVARAGRVVAHCQYEIPAKLDDASGVQFVSIDAAESLPLVQRLVEELSFTGQISFDYRRTERGLVFIECNPRATSGLSLMDDEALAGAICDPQPAGEPVLVPAGRKMQADLGIVNDVFARKLGPLRGLHDLLTIRDIYLDKHDIVPALYGLVALRHDRATMRLAHGQHADIADAVTDDVAWNGEDIAA